MSDRHFYEFGPFRLEERGRLLFREGQVVSLPPKAVDILLLLVQNAGTVVEKGEILKQVWQDAFVEEGSLTRTVSVLRKTLGNSERGQEFIATVPKRGYRLVPPVKIVGDNPVTITPGTKKVLLTAPTDSWLKVTALLAGVGMVIFLSILVYMRSNPLWSHARAGRQMIAVLPFENLTGDPSKAFLSDGLTEEMITKLGGLNTQQLGVIARTSAMTYRDTTKPLTQIGKELGVQYVVEGSVRAWGDRIRVSAQLLQVSDQTHIWAQNYDRDSGDVLALQSEVSEAIARQIRVKLNPETRERLAGARPVNPEAYEAYLKGRYFWYRRTEEALYKGIEFFQRSLQLEPNYAPAYVGLADSYLILAGRGLVRPRDVMPKAKASALKALEINSDLGEAHASLAHIRLHDWDWVGLDDEFRRAIELNPTNAFAYYYYSEYLMAIGRPEESIAMVKKVKEIDPVSPLLNTTLPSQYYFARKYDEASESIMRAIDLDPNYFLLHFRLAHIFIQSGKNQQAIQEMQKAVDLSGRSTEMLAGLGQAYAAAGMRKPTQEILDEIESRAKDRYVSPYYVAKIYGSLGDSEKALAWLQKAYEDRSVDMIELKIEPAFDGGRSDPRFADLLRRVGWRD